MLREVDAIFSQAYNRAMLRTALALLLVASCGPGRTSAREPPGPKFDPSKSDAEALATADAGVAALGGAEAWDKVQQLSFTVRYLIDGQPVAWYVHHWDRWNGRHNYRAADLKAEVPEDERPWSEVYYDVFDDGVKVHAFYDGNELDHGSANQFRAEAKKRLVEDTYWLTLPYRLRESGVQVTSDGETSPTDGLCEPSCKRVKVTFDPPNGRSTYVINYNTGTSKPEVIELERPGGGMIGYKLDGWTTVAGLEFATKIQNIGMTTEVVEFSDVKIGEPEDSLYMPEVR